MCLDEAIITGIHILKHHYSNYSTIAKHHVKRYKNSNHQFTVRDAEAIKAMVTWWAIYFAIEAGRWTVIFEGD